MQKLLQYICENLKNPYKRYIYRISKIYTKISCNSPFKNMNFSAGMLTTVWWSWTPPPGSRRSSYLATSWGSPGSSGESYHPSQIQGLQVSHIIPHSRKGVEGLQESHILPHRRVQGLHVNHLHHKEVQGLKVSHIRLCLGVLDRVSRRNWVSPGESYFSL